MLLNRVCSDQGRIAAVPGDISNGQAVDDLGKCEERQLGGKQVVNGASERFVVIRVVIAEWNACGLRGAGKHPLPRRDSGKVLI